MTTWADLLPYMGLYDLEQTLRKEGMATLRERLELVLPGRGLETLLEDETKRATFV